MFARPPLSTLSSFADVLGFCSDLVDRLEEAFSQNDTLELKELHVAPEKPRNGRLYYADGTDWDPGSGRGVYCYDSSGPTWRLLG